MVHLLNSMKTIVATAPTVHGIETYPTQDHYIHPYKLQQHLPYTVLKRCSIPLNKFKDLVRRLQQHLPYTVLKLVGPTLAHFKEFSCNSTYRSRY